MIGWKKGRPLFGPVLPPVSSSTSREALRPQRFLAPSMRENKAQQHQLRSSTQLQLCDADVFFDNFSIKIAEGQDGKVFLKVEYFFFFLLI